MQPEKISASALPHFAGQGKLLNSSSFSVRCGFAAACVLTAFVVRYSLAPWLKNQLPFAFFVPAALIAAWHGGPVTGFFALLAGLLLGDYFFAPPQAFGPSGPAGLITLLSCAVTVVIGVAMVGNLHRVRRMLASSEQDTTRLHREVSEHEQAEKILRESEARLRELADAMPQIVWAAGPEGQVEYVNRKWFEYTGTTAEETYAHDGWAEIVHPADRALVLAAVRKAVETSEPFQVEKRIRSRTGDYRWHLCRGLPLKDATGRVQRWFATSTDIEEQKRIEMDLEVAREQLARHARDLERRVVERTGKLEESIRSLEGVLYHVAHDLRAPLRAMEGFSQILLESRSAALSTFERDSALRIVIAATRMDQLIKDLLTYGRLSHMDLPRRKINLEARVDRSLVGFESEIKSRRAEIHVARPLPQVWANPLVLDQILVNLLSNALKFVTLGSAPHINIGAETNNQSVRVWIQDNGIGIDEIYQEQIFRVFERLEQDAGHLGTGIGLAIVRKGAERMGGAVGVESKPGHGSRFWIELPVRPLNA
jgi:PAS domain S-box-containing protein